MRWVATLLILLLSATIAHGSETEGIVKAVEENYRTIKTLEASFLQENRVSGRSEPILAKGRVILRRPNLTKWIYEVPKGQEILSDGTRIWIYQPSIGQVTSYPIEEEGRVVEGLLSGDLDPFRFFRISLEGEGKGHYYLSFKPKKRGSNIGSILVKVRKKDFMVTEITLEDPFGNTTKIVFKEIKKNPPLRPESFLLRSPEKGR